MGILASLIFLLGFSEGFYPPSVLRLSVACSQQPNRPTVIAVLTVPGRDFHRW